MLFFVACWLGTFFSDLFLGNGNVEYALIESPWSWLRNILDGGVDGTGFLIVPMLFVALVVVLYSEKRYWHGLFLILITVPIQSLWLHGSVGIFTFILFSVYLVFVSWLYARCVVCSRAAQG